MAYPALSGHLEGTSIEIRVHPYSSRRGVGGMSGGRLAVSVRSAPERGKANKEVLKVLSEVLGISPSRLEVMRGKGSRSKTVLARGLSPDEARKLLMEHIRQVI